MSDKVKHTQEKLVLSSSFLICTEEAKVIANFAPLPVDGLRVDVFEAIANAKRFIALWNACKDIPTEALEQGVVGEMKKACKELLSCLRSDYEGPKGKDLSGGGIKEIQNLIAKAEAQ